MLCEICGERKAEGKIVTDGMELAVCSGCRKFGREVAPAPGEGGGGRSAGPENEVLPDYHRRVRRAREEKGLSVGELGKEIMEKESVLHKVERGEMLPDDRLVKKLEKFLGIELRGVVGAVPAGQTKKLPKATLGDLVDWKSAEGD